MNDLSVHLEAIPEEPSSIVIKIAGSTNITNVSHLLMRMLDAFERSDNISVDLSGVTEIDAAGLQLFCSSHRSSIFNKKGFRIIGQDRPVIWEAAMASGQLRTAGCAIDTEHTCIWTGGRH